MTNPDDNRVREIARANCLTSGDIVGILIIVAMMILMYHVWAVKHLNDTLHRDGVHCDKCAMELSDIPDDAKELACGCEDD